MSRIAQRSGGSVHDASRSFVAARSTDERCRHRLGGGSSVRLRRVSRVLIRDVQISVQRSTQSFVRSRHRPPLSQLQGKRSGTAQNNRLVFQIQRSGRTSQLQQHGASGIAMESHELFGFDRQLFVSPRIEDEFRRRARKGFPSNHVFRELGFNRD